MWEHRTSFGKWPCTQPKIAKNAQKTQKYTSFRAYFRRFWTYFGRFYGWKSSFGAFLDTGIHKRTLPTYKWRKIFTIFSVSWGYLLIFMGQKLVRFFDRQSRNKPPNEPKSTFFVYESQNFSAQYTKYTVLYTYTKHMYPTHQHCWEKVLAKNHTFSTLFWHFLYTFFYTFHTRRWHFFDAFLTLFLHFPDTSMTLFQRIFYAFLRFFLSSEIHIV